MDITIILISCLLSIAFYKQKIKPEYFKSFMIILSLFIVGYALGELCRNGHYSDPDFKDKIPSDLLPARYCTAMLFSGIGSFICSIKFIKIK